MLIIKRRVLLLAFKGLLAGLLSFTVSPITFAAGDPNVCSAPANAYVVTSTHDSGPGTLRQAILDANTDGGTSRITFTTTTAIEPTAPLPFIEEHP